MNESANLKTNRDPVFIVQNGKAKSKILLPEEATEQADYAAQQLKYYLDLMTAVSIPIERCLGHGHWLALGSEQDLKPQNENDALGPDGFTIQREEHQIVFQGGKRGIIYSVYEFLEQLGCRFFTPKCEKVPVQPDLMLPQLNIRQVPELEYRYHNYIDIVGYPRFAVKSRINGPVPIKERFGGHLSYAWFVHTFNQILDPDEWFDRHPEYFSMVNGKRLKYRTQLCLTNPDVLKITIEKVKEALRAHPESTLISVSQNDWGNPCTCPNCHAIDQAEKSHAGSLIWFVNQVAEAIEPEFPNVIVDTLAYQYTRPAPRSIRPRHNVCVRLCSIEACFSHPLETCTDRSRQVIRPDGTSAGFIDDLRDWAKVCDRLYIWDYTTCFAHYPTPFPNWRVLQPNMQAFVRNHVKGVFEQGNGARGGGVDLNELRAYLIGKLLWDANCDLDRHRKEFLDYYYGDAAPFICQYIDLLCDIVEEEQIHVGFNDNCDRPYLTPQRLSQYDQLLKKGEEAVIGDPLRLPRVAKIRLSIRWVSLKNRMMRGEKADPEEIASFFSDWRAHGLTRIDEWVNVETTHRALLEGLWRGTEYYDEWWAEGEEEL